MNLAIIIRRNGSGREITSRNTVQAGVIGVVNTKMG
jgi:hypothetical protein